ncbi:TonB-dependent receptor plug domain-containing protein [Mangrovivirga cuniculi]|uniref:TonB-dependent receptor n=1 Tax=Mangrovivirga cuniculi TaxID=2715131 RepID=A0A4D7JKY8_9BACT|nr:TonB-dependent receptor [Mangrovivirga cuniculi]QCK16549.1 TonB-dependent receptor [Mangrovivirga cuniculi]
MITNNRALIFIWFFSIQTAFSQSADQGVIDSISIKELPEIVITATRTERQLTSLPMPVDIVTKEEISKINSVRLSDILNEQTGLITIPDFGNGEGIQLQGLDSQYTLILIDGVPLIGRRAGTLDLSRISVGNIKQIEIIKGASSSLYGNEALGGVINIITERPQEGFNGDVNYRYSTFNSHDLSTNLNFKKEKIGLSTFFNRFSSNGYDLQEGDLVNTVEEFYNYTLSNKLTYDFNKRTKFLLSGRLYYQNQDNVASDSLRGESQTRDWNTLLKVDHIFNNKLDAYLELYATNYQSEEYLNQASGERFTHSEFDQLFLRPEIRLNYQVNKNNSFYGGAGLTHERLERDDFFGTPQFSSPYFYIQYDGTINRNLNLILGARFDSHSVYKSQFSPKGAIRYSLNHKFAVKASVGYGFKTPDFRQLYFDFSNATIGYTVLGYNAVTTRIPQLESEGQLVSIEVPLSDFENDLKPESSIGYNLGFEFNPVSNIDLSLNLFRNDINNLIDTRVVARKTNGQNVFSYYNINRVTTQGVEFNFSYNYSEDLKLTGGYQLLYAVDRNALDVFDEGLVFARTSPDSPTFRLEVSDYFGLLNRSRHMFNFKVFYTIPEWKVDVNLRTTYRSKYGIVDSNGNSYLDRYDDFVNGYSIIDIAINKKIKKRYKIGLGADNIFNFTDPQNITNVPGRILYSTINVNF